VSDSNSVIRLAVRVFQNGIKMSDDRLELELDRLLPALGRTARQHDVQHTG